MRHVHGIYIGFAAILAIVLAGCGSSGASTSTSTSTQTGSGAVVLHVASPVSGAAVSTNTINVQGTVTPNDATVQIDGQSVAVGNGVFTGSATLQSGSNSIAVIGSASGYTPTSTTILVTQKSTQTSSSTSHSKSKNSGGQKATPGIAHAAPSTGGQTSCGGGLSVGPDTSCAFAENVYRAYENNGPGDVTAYSPVTQLNYTMYCSGSTPVVCTGGNNASVYFYP
jgi:Glucodextranase, domain B